MFACWLELTVKSGNLTKKACVPPRACKVLTFELQFVGEILLCDHTIIQMKPPNEQPLWQNYSPVF